jgi:hypothetical protein
MASLATSHVKAELINLGVLRARETEVSCGGGRRDAGALPLLFLLCRAVPTAASWRSCCWRISASSFSITWDKARAATPVSRLANSTIILNTQSSCIIIISTRERAKHPPQYTSEKGQESRAHMPCGPIYSARAGAWQHRVHMHASAVKMHVRRQRKGREQQQPVAQIPGVRERADTSCESRQLA